MAVLVESGKDTAYLTLDSPKNRNALSSVMVEELTAGLTAAALDDDVRTIVLGHTGTTFCAGADLREAGASPELRTRQMLDLMRLIIDTPKPVVAKIDGHVRAGGMGLVAACDVAVAGPESSFALTEVRLGLAASVISVAVLPRLTSRAASRYFLTGETFDGATAEAIGLVTVADAVPAAVVADYMIVFRKCSPQGLAESKRLTTAAIRREMDERGTAVAEQSARLFASDEAREGMMSFLEKRPPSWAAEK
ncbi:enoyl-CoA hydratase family protein [Rhodococcus sp. IEGM 1374]|uniref:enoyl-CoA hydratase family protein n=1 Tax=Rhodococcus sp. IEGM 1374 TaxID=3082221 RepID=UPI0029535A46|nr:enoyl-CoA hydratase family protein [Rhodococcus sp. IEGM 1374]MDV7991430.1 enoyl-CoA hydratase family protein [Rhodococcus sp. IEGM 1374]